jgi:hypothetical protein
MAQAPDVITVTIAAAGTAQRVVTSPTAANRFVKSANFVALHDNTGAMYIGPSGVSDTSYSTRLEAKEENCLVGDEIFPHPGNDNNLIDLYNTWVDADDSGDSVNVGISVRS